MEQKNFLFRAPIEWYPKKTAPSLGQVPANLRKDEYCMTCDFAVSTGTFQRAAQNSQILKLLIDTASDGLSQQFLKGHEEVSKDYKVMQRMACKAGFIVLFFFLLTPP